MQTTNKKIAFFGTPPFTIEFLEALKKADYKISLIVTNPDRKSGRGMKLASPEPKNWAQKENIEVLQPEICQMADDDGFFQELSKTEWDLFIVIAYGKIIPENIINLPKFGTINIHYSLLPKYRGATPVEQAILNGDTTTGITIQQMHYKLDSGPILYKQEIAIDPEDTTPSLREKLNNQAVEILPEVLEHIFDQKIVPENQDESSATHCKKISKESGLLNLSDNDVLNDRKYRAYFGSIGTHFFLEKNGKKVRAKITKAHLENEQFIIDEIIPENGKRTSYENL